eukprot:9481368-Pyramimonas_sp.AAC.1
MIVQKEPCCFAVTITKITCSTRAYRCTLRAAERGPSQTPPPSLAGARPPGTAVTNHVRGGGGHLIDKRVLSSSPLASITQQPNIES